MKAWHDVKDEPMFKVLLTLCLMAGTFQTTFAQRNQPHESKSTTTAVKYSAFGTAIPIVAGVAIYLNNPDEESSESYGVLAGMLGIVGGPGLGHAYAGRWGRLCLGSLVRTLGVGIILAGILGDDPSGTSPTADQGPYAVPIFIGGAICLWSAMRDFSSLDASVERYNQRHTGATIGVSPTYYASENAPGIAVSICF
jgi:hypothetical protein